jgi:signal transduction histidine kinase/ActR/RegA family two-component response regulator/PAS domain-containing protein
MTSFNNERQQQTKNIAKDNEPSVCMLYSVILLYSEFVRRKMTLFHHLPMCISVTSIENPLYSTPCYNILVIFLFLLASVKFITQRLMGDQKEEQQQQQQQQQQEEQLNYGIYQLLFSKQFFVYLCVLAYGVRVFEFKNEVPPTVQTMLLPMLTVLLPWGHAYDRYILVQILSVSLSFIIKPAITYLMMANPSGQRLGFSNYLISLPYLVSEFNILLTVTFPLNSFMFILRRQRVRKEMDDVTRHGTVLRAILDALPVSVWTTDKNLVIQMSHGHHLPKLGLAPNELAGQTLEQYFDRHLADIDNRDRVISGHLQVLSTEKSVSFQSQMHKSQIAQTILSPWLNESGDLIGVVGMSLDVTADKVRRQTEMNYESLVHTMNDNLIKIDQNLLVVFMNRNLASHTVQQTIGKPFLDLFEYDPALKTNVHNGLQKLFKDGTAFKWEWKFGNSYFSTSANSVKEDIDHDQVNAASVLTSDITERVFAEQNLMMAQKAKVASQSKSNFIASLSHEIRNPLAAVLGSLQLLSLTPLSELQMEYCEDAIDHSKLLLEIINSVLDMAKIESDTMQLTIVPTSIMDTLQNVADVSSVQAEAKGLELYTYVSPSLYGIQVLVDRVRLAQILSNFLNNSIKFTPSGYILLSAELVDNQAEFIVVRFSCEDSGIGIKSSDIGRVFEPFVQLRYDLENIDTTVVPGDFETGAIVDVKHISEQGYYKYKGMGLGLAISQRLAHLMDSEITVKSTFQKGSKFSCDLRLQKTSNVSSENKKNFKSKFEVVIVVHSSGKEMLRATIENYLQYLQVEHIYFVEDEKQLKDCLSANVTSKKHLAVLFEEYSDDLNNDYDYYSTLENTKVLVLVTQSQHFDLLHTNQSYTSVTFIRKPLKFSKLHSSLSDRRAIKINVLQSLYPKDIHKYKILLVEDHPVNRKVISKMLNTMGFNSVVPAEDGQDALEILDRTSIPFDLILMDLQMPRLDGLSASKCIRMRQDAHASTPIVALTANAWSNSVAKCKSCGMQEVVTKPTSIETLSEVIYTVITNKTKTNNKS